MVCHADVELTRTESLSAQERLPASQSSAVILRKRRRVFSEPVAQAQRVFERVRISLRSVSPGQLCLRAFANDRVVAIDVVLAHERMTNHLASLKAFRKRIGLAARVGF